MSLRMKIRQWGYVRRFCTQRISDYAELFAIELAETRKRLLRDAIALVTLAVSALLTLSFLCIAVIASAWQTPWFLAVVWGIAATWLVVSVSAFLVVRVQRPAEPFEVLQSEIQRDIETLKEALK